MSSDVELDSLVKRALAREPAAVARAISVAEDRRASLEPVAEELLRKLSRGGHPASARRVGITGPPGVGKSSLTSRLVQRYRELGRTVGVLAVDPSSPRSGGALLGDRARLELDPDDAGSFVRSMASGGQLGGLARAAGAAVEVLCAVYDVVLIETTGVGQSETDVEHVADSVLLVIQPASGDVLSFIKAGILEIPDVLAVNKADLGSVAERAFSDLQAALVVSAEASGGSPPPVLLTSATTRAGVDELVRVLDERYERLVSEGKLEQLRVAKSAAWAYRQFRERYGERGVERAGGKDQLVATLTQAIANGENFLESMRRAAVREP
ncbi:MAG: methylmalonyl Co-A mutase-associated GTPase MeaB [Polyangiaceae bacterium]